MRAGSTPEPPRVRAGVADAGRDVGARHREPVVGGLAEIERDDDQPGRGERPAHDGVGVRSSRAHAPPCT